MAEGVDVPALDGVAFIDPKRSAIDITQAVGRAIRKVLGAKTQKVGTIVIPVYVASTESPEATLETSAFEPVWSVVRALREHDDVLAEQLDELRRSLGRRATTRLELPPRLSFDLPQEVGLDFAQAFNVRLVERTTANWEFMYGCLNFSSHVRTTHACPKGTRKVNSSWECGSARNGRPSARGSSARTASNVLRH